MSINKVTFDHETLQGNHQTLKIAQVAPPWFSVPPKDYGGTETVISHLTEAQVKQGHNVTLFASGDSLTKGELRYYVEESLSQQKIPWSNPTEAEYHLLSSFREIAKSPERYDIVHIHLSSASDLIILKLVSQLQIPHLCTLHSRFPFDRRENHIGEGDRYYFSWADKTPMIAISNKAKEDALITSKLPLNFIGIIPHGLPEYYFVNDKASERQNLVWIGRITREKGTKSAIEAAIKARRKIIVAGVVDTYVSETAEYFYQEVMPLIEANPDYVEYIGAISNDEKLQLLKSAYCFLNPIQWEEPFGLVMIEAMACGCPVISYNRGAAQELIKPGKNGEFAESVEEMAGMVEAVGNNIDREQMVIDTWNNYSAKRMAELYEIKYREVINQCQGS